MTQHNVKDFGAKGDGKSDDAPAIQKAIANAAPGDWVLIPAGTYRMSAVLQTRVEVELKTELGTVLEYPPKDG